MYKFLSGLFFLSLLVVSCKFNPNLQDKGSDFLQGVWKEDKVEFQDQLLNYTLHTLKFECDSFYLTFETHSKVSVNPDTCYQSGQWTEYAKGGYLVKNDTIYLSGTFAKANFKQKISGCFRNGQYIESFIIKKSTADSLYLESTQRHIPILVALEQKITCKPKPVK